VTSCYGWGHIGSEFARGRVLPYNAESWSAEECGLITEILPSDCYPKWTSRRKGICYILSHVLVTIDGVWIGE
jgi:hypothetical protein